MAGREKLLGIDVPEAEAEVEADGARPSQDHDGPVVSELVFRDCQGADQGDSRQGHEEGEESAAPDIVLEEGLEDHEGQREECRHDEGDVQVPAEGRGVVDEAVVAHRDTEPTEGHTKQVPADSGIPEQVGDEGRLLRLRLDVPVQVIEQRQRLLVDLQAPLKDDPGVFRTAFREQPSRRFRQEAQEGEVMINSSVLMSAEK